MSTTRTFLFGTALLLFLPAPASRAQTPRIDDFGDPMPPGAVARLGTLRLRHVVRDGSGAACVVFSPDGKTVVAGGDAGLRAWDVATGKDLGWSPSAAPATAARFSADGKTLLTIDNNGTSRLWQAGTGEMLRETIDRFYHGQDNYLSADGRVAGVTGSGDHGIHLWETGTGKQLMFQRDKVRDLFFSAALSPDGKTLVVSSEGNRARLLDVATGKEVGQVEGPNKALHLAPGFARLREESVYGFAFSPDGKTLAGVSGKESFSVWNVADGRLRYTVKDCRGLLAFSPDGKHLLCGGDESMRLYETATGKEVRRFARYSGEVRALAFSPDGKTVATAKEYAIELWDAATGKRLHPFAGHATPVVSLAFSPDGSELASGDSWEGTLIVWSLKDRKQRQTFAGHFPERGLDGVIRRTARSLPAATAISGIRRADSTPRSGCGTYRRAGGCDNFRGISTASTASPFRPMAKDWLRVVRTPVPRCGTWTRASGCCNFAKMTPGAKRSLNRRTARNCSWLALRASWPSGSSIRGGRFHD